MFAFFAKSDLKTCRLRHQNVDLIMVSAVTVRHSARFLHLQSDTRHGSCSYSRTLGTAPLSGTRHGSCSDSQTLHGSCSYSWTFGKSARFLQLQSDTRQGSCNYSRTLGAVPAVTIRHSAQSPAGQPAVLPGLLFISTAVRVQAVLGEPVGSSAARRQRLPVERLQEVV